MAILVNGVKVAGVGVPGTNGKDATINGVNALTVEGLDPIVAQMVGSALQISLSGDIGGAKVETGSYVGTGTYGASNPNVIPLTFKAKYFIVGLKAKTQLNATFQWFGQSSNPSDVVNGRAVVTSTDTGMSWYSPSSADFQANLAGLGYCWVAIG